MKELERIELIVSEDGSHTIYVPSLNEHYHSVHGAINESLHVYINTGLKTIDKQHISILEVGFGTGLNALLTHLNSEGKQIEYQTYEKYPLEQKIWENLNYPHQSGESQSFFKQIHQSSWNQWVDILPDFRLFKGEGDFRQAEPQTGIDLVYFDAFAPDKQPDLWTQEVFEKIYHAMNPGAILVTYCAKGIIRRMLQDTDLIVERLPGPPPKKEMLRGRKG
jgi:tRNA U34 5-methylaminomethyl-2-thiouridine-forming methyltransferase MnmC